MTFDQLEAKMRASLSQFTGLGAKVKFDFGTDGALFLDATKVPTVSRDPVDVNTTLKISLADFVKLSEGKLSPTLAFTFGKLKVQGDMGVALKLAGMLDD
ncbi:MULTISPECIES: SCP2 sterol-binding domain-containing protein [Nitrospirillum]|uniref:Sterol carrier protein n=2 Tax=Nitrospirillum TaxID=1543705 RepID=A0A248JQB0_9PROT|nr:MULTISPECIES: SCP2 sterol-binding domain-containing protein [Nitrospirillum]ASG20943.1 sterol carrier protein [Nitrospirillum amazonense CBAmc]MDG3441882.1 SCP2 sterol-binding domain-containing protein [Nitrospirillum amazonense]MEA1650498.1 SCP2 sterol-binding domain-containing protein [Nitrospirillum sp. BR 11164]MEA1676690.1 SCP2 sterol-binding domain-containing protein [Nitrospirillum sp. BR 11163]MEC4593998.1 SCP2 sterol-binding domain-containing protein [Nitrospirillum amazonense]